MDPVTRFKPRKFTVVATLSSFALAMGFGAFAASASAQQNQQNGDDRYDQNSATVQQVQQVDPQNGPDRDRRAAGPMDRNREQENDRRRPSARDSVPSRLTLPAGTVLSVRTIDWVSSDKSRVGDRFSASLSQPLIANGWVVARRGQMLTGRVAIAQKASHREKPSQLGIELSELTLVDGQIMPVRTQLVQSSAGTSNGRDVATVATTTGVGAVIGGIAGGGEGVGVGAGIGAAAGIIGVLSTPGRATVIPAETLLTFRLDVPLTIITERSEVAFQPVGQGDYGADQDAYAAHGDGSDRPARRVVVEGGYGYPGYYYDPFYYSGWGYPAFGLGYYRGGYYGGYRGGFRGGYRGGGFRR